LKGEFYIMKTTTKLTLSKPTIQILKNFSAINSNLLIRPGNKLVTMSSYKNIVAEAMVEETFEQEFGIWDLSQFLGIISLFDQPELELHDKYMEISNEAGSSVKYFYCEPKLITSLPPKALNMPAAVLQFPLTEKKLQELQKASSVLQVSDMSIYAEDGEVFAKVCDSKDNTTNSYSISLGSTEDCLDSDYSDDFEFRLKMENLKLIPGSYDVQVGSKVITKFTSKNLNLTYWIALESGSKTGE